MQQVTTLSELRAARAEQKSPLGLVPTMGYLHEGHISLVRAARAECASVAASIFVNPSQFGPNEDLAKYPRNLERDLALLEAAGCDLVWTPTPDIVYPANYQTWITVDEVTRRLEGEIRPGHFRGVATVVAKLFNAVQPERAYFGQKDAQQVRVVQQMTHDLNMPVEIVVCPIVREPDGLAMSSRNSYLTPEQRRAAPVLYRALSLARDAFRAGQRDAETLRAQVRAEVNREPLASLQYISCADPETFAELEQAREGALLLIAARVGSTRLIDNLVL